MYFSIVFSEFEFEWKFIFPLFMLLIAMNRFFLIYLSLIFIYYILASLTIHELTEFKFLLFGQYFLTCCFFAVYYFSNWFLINSYSFFFQIERLLLGGLLCLIMSAKLVCPVCPSLPPSPPTVPTYINLDISNIIWHTFSNSDHFCVTLKF